MPIFLAHDFWHKKGLASFQENNNLRTVLQNNFKNYAPDKLSGKFITDSQT